MSSELLVNDLKAYMATHDIKSAAALGRILGIERRRMNNILKYSTKISEDERKAIHELMGSWAGLIPPKSIESKKQNTQKKASSRQSKDTQDAVGVYRSIKIIVQMFRQLRGYKTDTMAASVLVLIGWATIQKQGTDNFDFSVYETLIDRN